MNHFNKEPFFTSFVEALNRECDICYFKNRSYYVLSEISSVYLFEAESLCISFTAGYHSYKVMTFNMKICSIFLLYRILVGNLIHFIGKYWWLWHLWFCVDNQIHLNFRCNVPNYNTLIHLFHGTKTAQKFMTRSNICLKLNATFKYLFYSNF